MLLSRHTRLAVAPHWWGQLSPAGIAAGGLVSTPGSRTLLELAAAWVN
jgi:hypothetical protein